MERKEDRRSIEAGRLFIGLVGVASAWYALEALRIPNPPVVGDPLGPRMFPLVLGLLSLALSLLVLRERENVGAVRATREELRSLLWVAAGMAGYAVLLPRLGFVISTALFLAGGFAYTGGRRPLLVGALVACGIYVLFRGVLGVYLPPGMLRFR